IPHASASPSGLPPRPTKAKPKRTVTRTVTVTETAACWTLPPPQVSSKIHAVPTLVTSKV
ncbi:hypothetical protein CPB97_000467, partial [Podila verticillata]